MMKKFFLLVIIVVACEQTPNPFLGTFCTCSYDGTYTENHVGERYIVQIDSGMELSVFSNSFYDNTQFVKGINSTLLSDSMGYRFIKKTEDMLYGYDLFFEDTFEFEIINNVPLIIDSSRYESWQKKLFDDFHKRRHQRNCPDKRTEEEKTILLGIIEDDFEEPLEPLPYDN